MPAFGIDHRAVAHTAPAVAVARASRTGKQIVELRPLTPDQLQGLLCVDPLQVRLAILLLYMIHLRRALFLPSAKNEIFERQVFQYIFEGLAQVIPYLPCNAEI